MYGTLNTANLLNITVSHIYYVLKNSWLNMYCTFGMWRSVCRCKIHADCHLCCGIYNPFGKLSHTKVGNRWSTLQQYCMTVICTISKRTFNGSLKSKLTRSCHSILLVIEHSRNFLSCVLLFSKFLCNSVFYFITYSLFYTPPHDFIHVRWSKVI